MKMPIVFYNRNKLKNIIYSIIYSFYEEIFKVDEIINEDIFSDLRRKTLKD